MKKLLVLGLLSIAAVTASARSADAWFFDNWRCKKCCTEVCIRPYNAFTPVACGTITACGCMPFSYYGGGYGAPQPSCFGYPSYGPGGCTTGYCDTGCLPAPGSVATGIPATSPVPPTQPMPQGAPGQQFQAPIPQMINPGAYMMPMQPGYGYAPVQAAGYYQQPMYNPYGYQMVPVNYYQPAPAPSYWYGR